MKFNRTEIIGISMAPFIGRFMLLDDFWGVVAGLSWLLFMSIFVKLSTEEQNQ